jgi:hypothetical protein
MNDPSGQHSETVEQQQPTATRTGRRRQVDLLGPVENLGKRVSKPNPRYFSNQAKVNLKGLEDLLLYAHRITLSKALRDEEKMKLTIIAIKDELENLFYKQRALVPTLLKNIKPEHLDNVLNCHMFLTDKFTPEGEFERRKGRVVINGNEQTEGFEDGEARSPTVNLISFFMLLAIAVIRKAKNMRAYDIVGAFLATEYPEDKFLYVVTDKLLTSLIVQLFPELQPYVTDDGRMYFRVCKYVYGLVEASRKFYEKLDRTLIAMGYQRSAADSCLYFKDYPEGQHTLCCYVDDIFSLSPSERVSKIFEAEISKVFQIKVKTGSKLSYLGMNIICRDDGSIDVNQTGYVQDILDKYPLPDGIKKKARTPADPSYLSDLSEGNNLGQQLDKKQKSLYASMIMSLMYVARLTRIDILTAVTILATRLKDATERDLRQAYRVIQYLNATQDRGLTFRDNGHNRLGIYADASNLLHPDGYGHSGILITMGGNIIFARSAKQKIVTRSSTEAELVATEDASTYAPYLIKLCSELKLQVKPIVLFQDNKSAIIISLNGGTFKRTKHMVGRLAYLRERINLGDIVLRYIPTKKMKADLLTKLLSSHELTFHLTELGVIARKSAGSQVPG